MAGTPPPDNGQSMPQQGRAVRGGQENVGVSGPELAIMLRNTADEIVLEWSRALKSGSYAGYADVPIDELESACSQCLSAFVATLKDGDHGKMRRFVHREVRTRLKQGYHESEIDQLLCSLRLAAWPIIARYYPSESRKLVEALMLLQHCVEQALFELSDYYQATAQQQAEEHLAEMEAMNRRLEEISVRDALTGLYNRRFFQDRLEQEFHRTQRHHRPLCFLMVDVDHFKSVNDTHGHQAGDHVLRGLALALINQTRTIDIVSRYGGEEFAILLPETERTGAHELAERLREFVALAPLHRIDAEEGSPMPLEATAIHCTVSIGVAAFDGEGMQTPEELIGAADAALYAAKHGGRNRVVAAWEMPAGVATNGSAAGQAPLIQQTPRPALT